jgi:hypothetical protein
MDAEILARRERGWVWLDDRVPVDEGFDEVGQAVQAGVEAIEERVERGELDRDEAAELAADARFELGANEHHLGSRDSAAIQTLVDFEDGIR